MKHTVINSIVIEAEQKFGTVKAICIKEPIHNTYVLRIERSDPAFADRPYMTILGYCFDFSRNMQEWKVAFEHGHYDLDRDESQKDFVNRFSN